jgi:polysaccharide deacetylase 2 family uncharacterized protein YibQ
MTVKKRKRRTREYAITPKGLLLLLLLFLGCISILVFFYYLSHADKTVTTPIYEEINATNSRFIGEVVKIEDAIYESLYREGIPEQNILFLSVTPRVVKSNAWDFTELWVKLPNRNTALHVTQIIGNELSSLRPDVRYTVEGVSKGEKVLHIYALDLYSHKVRVTWEDHQKPLHKEGLPRIAIIIDDMGYDPYIIDGFLKLDLPLAFSVLPQAPYTQSIAKKARNKGHELILHLPMEPTDYPTVNPGPGALLTKMSTRKIKTILNRHLDEIPGIRGVNNHMGSFFTAKRDKMAVVMRELKKRNLFYIDSRTTTETVAHELAEMMGVPVASRSVFLDNDLSSKVIRFQMERLLGIARHSGAAIGIGHPNEETLDLLKNYLGKLRTRVKVVPVSELIGQVPEVSKMNF